MTAQAWSDGSDRCFGMLMDGRAQSSGTRKRGDDATMLLVLNSWQDAVGFIVPAAPEGIGWQLLVDTNAPENEEALHFRQGDVYQVTARSLLLFLMQTG
jgi:isoamylase